MQAPVVAAAPAPAVGPPPGARPLAAKRGPTVWVGRIPPSVTPQRIQELLEACGPLKAWRPVLDVETGRHKGFGFCTFAKPESACAALAALDGLDLGGRRLMLKPSQAVVDFLEAEGSGAALAAAAAARETVAGLLGQGAASAEEQAVAEQRERTERERRERLGREERERREREELEVAERVHRAYLREWEEHERSKFQQLRREEREHQDAATERARALREDELGGDGDGRAFWDLPYARSRRAADRRARRAAEQAEDILERAAGQAKAEGDAEPSTTAPTAAVTMSQLGSKQGRGARAAATAFGDDGEEEDTSRRGLVPIQYTREETVALVGGGGSAAGAGRAGGVDSDIKKRIIAQVPRDREGVFAANIEWRFLDDAPDEVLERVKTWVAKRVQQLLGEEEASFVEFIMSLVAGRQSPRDTLEALQDVLDDDAPAFVTKLFQVLIYEILKLKHGIS